MTKKAIETLEFRGILVLLGLLGAAILYFSAFHGHRPPLEDAGSIPTVPAGDQPPPSRL